MTTQNRIRPCVTTKNFIMSNQGLKQIEKHDMILNKQKSQFLFCLLIRKKTRKYQSLSEQTVSGRGKN